MAHFTWMEFNGDHVHQVDNAALGEAVKRICSNHHNERIVLRDLGLQGTLSYLGEAFDPWTPLITPQHTMRTLRGELESAHREIARLQQDVLSLQEELNRRT